MGANPEQQLLRVAVDRICKSKANKSPVPCAIHRNLYSPLHDSLAGGMADEKTKSWFIEAFVGRMPPQVDIHLAW